jgi:hypothetical protein
MSTPPPLRRHRRAAGQLLLGLVPLLVVGLVSLALLALRLPAAQAPVAAATSTARASVTATDRPADGLTVTFADEAGRLRTGVVRLRRPVEVPVGAPLTVRYDPRSAADPLPVVTGGDATTGRVTDLVFGAFAVVVVLVVATALTLARLLTRPRLRHRPATRATATHVVSRQGLLVRSWLELTTPSGLRWLPVHWAPELDRLSPETVLEVRGDPGHSGLVLPVVGGTEIWPSGRLRGRAPRGDVRQAAVDPDAGDLGLGRQARADGVAPFLAPALGLLWAYVASAGLGGFLLATALVAAVVFWVPQLLGSDPRARGRS